MKKKILVALVLCLVLILSVALVACGDKGGNTPQQGVTDDGGSSGGQSGGSSGGGQGGGSGSGGSGGGQGGGQGGGSQTPTRTLPTEAAILQTVGTTSFKLAVGNLAGDAVTTVATNGTYYYFANPSVTFGKIIGDFAYPYTKQSGKTKYTKMESRNGIPDLIHMGNVGNLFLYAGQTISYDTEEAVTFINRAAKKYTVTYFDPGNNAHVQELIIDDATGACLKHDAASSPTDGFVGGNSKTSFAATEIAYGTNSAISAFLNPLIANIDVYEWDTAYLTQAGLSTAVSSPATAWQFQSSKFANNADRTSEEPNWTAVYYYTDDRDGTESSISSFVESFYTAGANMDDNGVEKTYDNLCSYDVDDHSYYLSSYTSDGYLVLVSADYQIHLNPTRWIITVQIEKF